MLSTVTSASLLADLADPAKHTAWRLYVERYRPLLLRYAERVGVPRGDCEDVAQDTLAAFSDAYRRGKYDRARGRLRVWLFGIATTTIRTYWRLRERTGRIRVVDGDDAVERVQDERTLDDLWDEQWRDAVLAAALREVRAEVEPQTFAAFDLFACRALPARDVAEQLGISENAVFCAKQRVLRRLRELLPVVEEIF